MNSQSHILFCRSQSLQKEEEDHKRSPEQLEEVLLTDQEEIVQRITMKSEV